MVTMTKLNELGLKWSRKNDEVILESDAFFRGLEKSFNKKGIEMLEKRWNDRDLLADEFNKE